MTEINQNVDPSLFQGQGLPSTGQILSVEGVPPMRVFEIPTDPENYLRNDRIAVDNPDGFSRMVRGGIDQIKEGESITFVVSSASSLGGQYSPEVRTIQRQGESVIIREAIPQTASVLQSADQVEAAEVDQELSIDQKQAYDFCKGLEANSRYLGFMTDLAERSDSLGEFVKAIGYAEYSEQGMVLPVPLALQENLKRARDEGGLNVVAVRVLDTAAIPGATYNEAWEDGEFPISNRYEWYGHDGAGDHFSSLVVFGHEIMPIGQLFAQASVASESISLREYPNEYEINKGDNAQKVEVRYSGQAKIDETARRLDSFTAQLNGDVSQLDKDPFDEGDEYDEGFIFTPEHMDYVDEIVAVIMASPEHAKQLTTYLESIGSKVLVNGKFDRELYQRELVARAQQHWGITPRPKQIRQQEDSRIVG